VPTTATAGESEHHRRAAVERLLLALSVAEAAPPLLLATSIGNCDDNVSLPTTWVIARIAARAT
jgi:hypothetical protein